MADEIRTPTDNPVRETLLPDCPDAPNCVSSLARDPARRVAPFPLRETVSLSIDRLTQIIRSMPRATVTSRSPGEIRAEFRSLLGFVDDVIFAADPETGLVHVRSASRKGKWDLGVNRRRVERIRRQYMGRAD